MQVLKSKKFIILIVLVLLSTITYVYAKYFNNYKESSLYTSEDFYFRSDVLSIDGVTYNYQRGITMISIKLYNNEDTLRYTESDIKYSVKITSVSGENVISSANEEINEVTGTLRGGKISSETINFDNLQTGTYKIIATTSEPFVKTLVGTFVITEQDKSINYEISDNVGSTVLFLTISDTDYKGVISVNVPDGLYPDNTIPAFKDIDLSGSKVIKLDFKENSSYTYKFFKEDPNSLYHESDFLIEGE